MTVYPLWYREVFENNIEVKECNCYMQKCKGRFVPSRPNQTVCLYEIWRLEELTNPNK